MVSDGKTGEMGAVFVHYGENAKARPVCVDNCRIMHYDGIVTVKIADIISDKWPESFYRDACQSHDYW